MLSQVMRKWPVAYFRTRGQTGFVQKEWWDKGLRCMHRAAWGDGVGRAYFSYVQVSKLGVSRGCTFMQRKQNSSPAASVSKNNQETDPERLAVKGDYLNALIHIEKRLAKEGQTPSMRLLELIASKLVCALG